MARLAVLAPPFLGHLNPMRALVRALVRRGHSAAFVGMADLGPLVEEEGIGFRPIGADSHPPGHLAGMLHRMGRVDGLFGLGGIIRDVAAMTAMLVRDLPDALRAMQADLVLCDGTEAAGGLVAKGLGLPHVTVANALPLNREPAMPPPFMGWRYDPSPWGVERNRGGYRVADLMMRRQGAVIDQAATRWKLGPRRTVADCLSPYAQVGQIVAGLDFPRTEAPAVLHRVGPLRDPPRKDAPAFPLPEPDGRPLAYVSLGTLMGGRFDLFHRIAEAAASQGVRLILAHGGLLTEAQCAVLPGSVSAHAFVPQDAVLARADVAILNCGLNTVMDALARGVPIVALPIAFEQEAIAARIERARVGLCASRRRFGGRSLGAALAEVSRGEAYRGAAGALAAEIAEAGGVERAADVVEAVLRTGRPVLRDVAPAPPAPVAAPKTGM